MNKLQKIGTTFLTGAILSCTPFSQEVRTNKQLFSTLDSYFDNSIKVVVLKKVQLSNELGMMQYEISATKHNNMIIITCRDFRKYSEGGIITQVLAKGELSTDGLISWTIESEGLDGDTWDLIEQYTIELNDTVKNHKTSTGTVSGDTLKFSVENPLGI